jgi:hypothetical protein
MTNFELFLFVSSLILLGFSFSSILALVRRVVYFKTILDKRKAFFDKTLELIADREGVDVQKYLNLALDLVEGGKHD